MTRAAALVKKWQPLLGLSHWEIQVEVVESPEDLADRLAATSYNRTQLTALIRIHTPTNHANRPYIGNAEPRERYEASVIHELLHLRFTDHRWPDETPQEAAEHDTINILSRVLSGAA